MITCFLLTAINRCAAVLPMRSGQNRRAMAVRYVARTS